MPVRHEGDFQRKPIRSWDDWVEEEILKAQANGEFANLPDFGKPIKLEDTPFAPEMASALRTLKNAGFEPAWMELDRKITHGRQEMEAYLRRSTAYLDRLMAEASGERNQVAPPASPIRPGRWRRFLDWLTMGDAADSVAQPPLSPADFAHIRAQMREQYLERAAAVDKTITEFHAALPRNLWHLERMRLTPEAASKAFDAACPRVSVPQD